MTSDNEQVEQIIDLIEELKTDSSIPKNLIIKLNNINSILEGEGDTSIKVDKVIHILDDLTNDANLPSYTRTQLWNVVSLLEMI